MTILSKEEWLRRKYRRRRFRVMVFLTTVLGISLIVLFLLIKAFTGQYLGRKPKDETIEKTLSNGVEIQTDYLTVNPYSRPGKELKRVKGIVIHYTANPGTSAANNRSYFQGLAKKQTTYASSHYIIGMEGEVLQCIPLTEIAYASNHRNEDTIAIECCHPDKSGEFTEETKETLIALAAALCKEYNLEEKDILRHYDVTGKLCPLYYVEHEEQWVQLKMDIMAKAMELRREEKNK